MANETRPICKNCKHAIPERGWLIFGSDWLCGKPEFGQIVDGHPMSCETRRNPYNLCGVAGTGFEPK